MIRQGHLKRGHAAAASRPRRPPNRCASRAGTLLVGCLLATLTAVWLWVYSRHVANGWAPELRRDAGPIVAPGLRSVAVDTVDTAPHHDHGYRDALALDPAIASGCWRAAINRPAETRRWGQPPFTMKRLALLARDFQRASEELPLCGILGPSASAAASAAQTRSADVLGRLEALVSLRRALGRPLRVLLFNGASIRWGFNGLGKTPLSEILQWSDLYAALTLLGADTYHVWAREHLHPRSWMPEEEEQDSSPDAEPQEGWLSWLLSFDSTATLDAEGRPSAPMGGGEGEEKRGDRRPFFDVVFVDYIGWFGLEKQLRRAGYLMEDLTGGQKSSKGSFHPFRVKSRVFLVDAFGTSPEFNAYDRSHPNASRVSMYCCRKLPLHRILTLAELPGSGNGVLGHVVPSRPHIDTKKPRKRENRVVLSGKECRFLLYRPDGVVAVAREFSRRGFQVVSTIRDWDDCSSVFSAAASDGAVNVTNMGTLSQSELQELLFSSKAMVGMGKPFLGAGIYEANANGAALVLPELHPALDCHNDEELAGKPTCFKWRTQHPLLTESDPPRTWVIDYSDPEAVARMVAEIAALPDDAFVPSVHESVRAESFLLRVGALVADMACEEGLAPCGKPGAEAAPG